MDIFNYALCFSLKKSVTNLWDTCYLLKGKSDKFYDESSRSPIVFPQSLPSYSVFKLLSWRQSDILHGLLVQALALFF